MREWIFGTKNVFVKGSLVLCENAIYSYQMKLGWREYTFDGPVYYLINRENCPSATTRKHWDLINTSLSSLDKKIKYFECQFNSIR